MTKKIPRHDESWAIGKGAVNWIEEETGLVYTTLGFALIQYVETWTYISIIHDGKLVRRVFEAKLTPLRASIEARRFIREIKEV